MKIKVNQEICIGCGACVSTCDNFEMVETSKGYKAKVKEEDVEEIGCNKDAMDSCPVDAIKINE